jgi:hypothetical protein
MRDEEDEDYDEDDEGNPLGRRSTDLWFRNWFIPNYFGPDSSLANFFNLTEEQAQRIVDKAINLEKLNIVDLLYKFFTFIFVALLNSIDISFNIKTF